MSERISTDLLIVGAGPFGLALAAAASDAGVEHVVVGEPMSFWRDHMPAGMLLRSDTSWHLDPANVLTVNPTPATPGSRSGLYPNTPGTTLTGSVDSRTDWPVPVGGLSAADRAHFGM